MGTVYALLQDWLLLLAGPLTSLLKQQLRSHELAEPAPFCPREDLVRSLLGDDAILKHDDALGSGDTAQPVRGEHDGDVLRVDDVVDCAVDRVL